jgi:hypothetical protein
MKQIILVVFLLTCISLSAQKVGVNKTIPEYTLDVRSTSIGDASQINISNPDKSRYLRLFSGSDAFPDPAVTWVPGNDLLLATFDNNTLVFNELMRITSQGNIGIGTANPDQKLTLQGKLKLSDDANIPEEGTIRYNATSDDFEGYDGTSYKSFTTNSATYIYDQGSQTTHTLRDDYVISDVDATVNETGTYFITFRCEVFDLIGNVNTAPSDFLVEVYLVEDDNGSISFLDVVNRQPLSDQTGGGITYRWRNSEKFSNFMIRNLTQGSNLKLFVKVNDNNIGSLSTTFFITSPEIFAFKL